MNNNIGYERLNDKANHTLANSGGFSAELHKDGAISMVKLYKERSAWVADIMIQAPKEDGFETSERVHIGSARKLSAVEAAFIANSDTFAGAHFNMK